MTRAVGEVGTVPIDLSSLNGKCLADLLPEQIGTLVDGTPNGALNIEAAGKRHHLMIHQDGIAIMHDNRRDVKRFRLIECTVKL